MHNLRDYVKINKISKKTKVVCLHDENTQTAGLVSSRSLKFAKFWAKYIALKAVFLPKRVHTQQKSMGDHCSDDVPQQRLGVTGVS